MPSIDQSMAITSLFITFYSENCSSQYFYITLVCFLTCAFLLHILFSCSCVVLPSSLFPTKGSNLLFFLFFPFFVYPLSLKLLMELLVGYYGAICVGFIWFQESRLQTKMERRSQSLNGKCKQMNVGTGT